MKFDLKQAIEILERTPLVLKGLLGGLSEAWTDQNEGPHTWSPYEVLGHLIHGEKTDWIIRTRIILSPSDNKCFEPFDRFAQLEETTTPSMADLLNEFAVLRTQNLLELNALKLTPDDLKKVGIHPAFGEVTLEQLIATWAVHDLSHLAQISRVMAKQYKEAVGPWVEYLGILN